VSTGTSSATPVTYNDALDAVRQLDQDEQIRLISDLRTLLFPDPFATSTLALNLKERRFHKGLTCPHCASDQIQRSGHYRNRQRYRCKSCQRTFNDATGTPLAGTHLLGKWEDYIECMVKGMSLRKICKKLGITLTTAFTWRHKVLNALKRLTLDGFKGVLEADETYMLHSLKGAKDLGGRKPRKRGGKSEKRGISNDQDCILVARDRTGGTLARVACQGRISMRQAMTVLEGKLEDVTFFCTDAHGTWRAVAKAEEMTHVELNASKGERVRGLYHIQNVNGFHRRLKQWMERFNGVASKFLDNYLAWFLFLDAHSSEIPAAACEGLLAAAFMNPAHETYHTIKNTTFALPA